jgi:universal stress protein A
VPTESFNPLNLLVESAKERLKVFAAGLGLEGAALQVVVGLGSPKQEIVRYAQEGAVDLIVVGTHGRRGVMHWLGSTAVGVLHRASCEVLAVPPSPAGASGTP